MKKNLTLVYASWAILYIGLVLIFKYVPQSASISFLAVIFALVYLLLPGWLINRFIRLDGKNLSGEILVSFVTSLGFYLLTGLSAIFLGLRSVDLLLLNSILTIFLFLGAFYYDWKKDRQYHLEIKWDISLANYIFPIIICLAVLFFIDSSGANYNGDPYFHLSIIRKAIGGLPLTYQNLLYTHSANNNPAYLLPAWHLIVSNLAQIFRLDVIAAWNKFDVTLVVVFFFSLYYFIEKIFSNRLVVITTFLISLFFIFFSGPGYFLERLVVPDTFSQFILVPLGLAFSLEFIFGKDRRYLIPIFILIIALLDIHAVHYLYYFLTLLVYAIILTIASFKERKVINRIWLLVSFNVILGLLLAIAVEIKNSLVITNLRQLWSAKVASISYPTFQYFPTIYKFGLVILPATFLFRNRKALLIAASFLLIPLIYWTPLRDVSIRFLSFIFTDRLLANAGLYYLIIGSLVGGFFLIIGSLLAESKLKNFEIISLAIAILLALTELIFHPFSNFIYQFFFAQETLAQSYGWAWPIFIISILAVMGYLLWQVFSKKTWPRTDKKMPLYELAVIVFVIFFFYPAIFSQESPGFKIRFFSSVKTTDISLTSGNFGREEPYIDFINQSIPAKSTILADGNISRNLPIFTDDFVVYYPGTVYASKFKEIYNGDFNAATSEEILADPRYKIDYIIVSPQDFNKSIFSTNPDYVQVYNQDVIIYKVK